ncbi:MAG: response regulator [Thermoproteota archaeon]|nr:response regulator [Thermoproteota archaeon]
MSCCCAVIRMYDAAAIDSINEGLEAGQLCIYASVFNGDKSHLSKISSKIANYLENIEKGNLVIIDFRPFYESAKASNLVPFKHLKKRIEELLHKRISDGEGDKVLIFAEAAGFLSEHCHFDKSVELESWWNDAHFEWLKDKLNITVLCPHSATVLNEESNLYAKSQISKAHSLTLDLQKGRIRANSGCGLRALIVEPEKDIQKVYRAYLAFRGVNAVIADDIRKCLEQIFSTYDEGFEVVIIDTHLQNSISSAIELAKTIKNAIPDQKIIVTTTSPLSEVGSKMKSLGISEEDLLVKPFELSRLLSLIQAQARTQ